MIFGTNVCGFRSYSGNQLDCTSTMILCPFKKVWSTPCRLHLNSVGLSRHQSLWPLKTLPIPPSKNLIRNHQLIPRHIPCSIVRIDVNQLHHPVRIASCSRRKQVRHHIPSHRHIVVQNRRRKIRQILSTTDKPLILHQPRPPLRPLPIRGLNRPDAGKEPDSPDRIHRSPPPRRPPEPKSQA